MIHPTIPSLHLRNDTRENRLEAGLGVELGGNKIGATPNQGAQAVGAHVLVNAEKDAMKGVDQQRRRVNPDVMSEQRVSVFAPRLKGSSPKREPHPPRGQLMQIIQHQVIWHFRTWFKSVSDFQTKRRESSPKHTPTAGFAPKATESSP